MMIKKLCKVGNSLGLIIDRPVLELLNIDSDTRLEVRTDGVGLTIRPVQKDETAVDVHQSRVRMSAQRVADDHSEAFKKLASGPEDFEVV